MEATNLLDFYTLPKAAEAKAKTCKPSKPPTLKEALKLMTPKLLPYAMTLVGHVQNAEDLCQQTLIKLIENEEKFLNAEYPYAYARKILKNLFIDKYRQEKRTNNLEDINLEPCYEQNLDASLEHRDLLDCLAKHEETERTVLGMLGAGHSYQDIQRFLGGISLVNLRVKASRARATLADCMEGNNG